jgi:hypothetical protein
MNFVLVTLICHSRIFNDAVPTNEITLHQMRREDNRGYRRVLLCLAVLYQLQVNMVLHGTTVNEVTINWKKLGKDVALGPI